MWVQTRCLAFLPSCPIEEKKNSKVSHLVGVARNTRRRNVGTFENQSRTFSSNQAALFTREDTPAAFLLRNLGSPSFLSSSSHPSIRLSSQQSFPWSSVAFRNIFRLFSRPTACSSNVPAASVEKARSRFPRLYFVFTLTGHIVQCLRIDPSHHLEPEAILNDK